jgi:hypothetical protein
MRSVAFTSAVMAVLAGIAMAQCPALPTVTIPIDQYVPENHGLDGPRLWQLAVCSPATYSQCGTIPASYVIEINGNGDGCDVGFNTDSSFGVWTDKYGGKNSFFSGASSPGGSNDRIANVTLICDQSASQPAADGPVVAYSSQGGVTWNFDIRVKTTAACGGGPSPPSPPNPTPPSPPWPTPPTPPGPTPPTPPPGPQPPAPPAKKDEGTSWVAILFVVLVFVVPCVYVGAFVAYNYFKLGKRGVKELIPHQDFWKDFPVLCLDGCKFVKNKFMQLIGKGDGTGSYGGAAEGSYTKV